jgi:outer membrane protein assembly factor BamB
MPREADTLIFVGIKNAVVALDDRTGEAAWKADLKTSDFVTVIWDGESVIAANAGEVWKLDPRTGAIVWHNELKGIGRGLVSLASSRERGPANNSPNAVSTKRRRDAAAAAAAG